LNQVRARLSEQQIELVIGNEVRDFLLKEGFDEEYGARPLRRAIQTYVDDTLADALLADEISSGQAVELVVQDDRIVVRSLEELQNQNV
jgi:ATP-dependent Clp protease ATP-binding subunit ClpC